MPLAAAQPPAALNHYAGQPTYPLPLPKQQQYQSLSKKKPSSSAFSSYYHTPYYYQNNNYHGHHQDVLGKSRHFQPQQQPKQQAQRRKPRYRFFNPAMFDNDDSDSSYSGDPDDVVAYGFGPTSELSSSEKPERERTNMINKQIDSHSKPMSGAKPYTDQQDYLSQRKNINKDPYDAYMKQFYNQPTARGQTASPHYVNTTALKSDYDPDSRKSKPDFVLRDRSEQHHPSKPNVIPAASASRNLHHAQNNNTGGNQGRAFFVRTKDSQQNDDLIRRLMDDNNNNNGNKKSSHPPSDKKAETPVSTTTAAPAPAENPVLSSENRGSPIPKPPPRSPSPVAMPQAKDGKYANQGGDPPIPEYLGDLDDNGSRLSMNHQREGSPSVLSQRDYYRGGGFMGFVKDLTRKAKDHYYDRQYQRSRGAMMSEMNSYYGGPGPGTGGFPPPGMGSGFGGPLPPGSSSRYRSRYGGRHGKRGHRDMHHHNGGLYGGGWGWPSMGGYGAWGSGFSGFFYSIGEFCIEFITRFPQLWFLLQPIQSISASRFYYLRTPLIFVEVMFIMLLVYYVLLIMEFLFSILKVMCTPAIVLSQFIFGSNRH